MVVTEPYGTEPQIPGIALHHPFRRAFTCLQVEMSFPSPSTASSLNNQAEESASVVVLERSDSPQGEGGRCCQFSIAGSLQDTGRKGKLG